MQEGVKMAKEGGLASPAGRRRRRGFYARGVKMAREDGFANSAGRKKCFLQKGLDWLKRVGQPVLQEEG